MTENDCIHEIRNHRCVKCGAQPERPEDWPETGHEWEDATLAFGVDKLLEARNALKKARR